MNLLAVSTIVSLLLGLALADIPTTPDNVCAPNPPNPSARGFSMLFANCGNALKKGLASRHPDEDKNTGQILETYGYPYEVHNITTQDGYILTVFRITGSPNLPEQQNSTKQAVFLAHGITLASDCWNFQPGSRNLPFKLADAGYEVWIGNARGTSYSLGHTKLDYNRDLKYWDFSWHEMGIYDVPAVIDNIIKVSGNHKIFYVGHSMGTTQLFVSLSEIPEMNDKIHAAFMLSPIAYQGHLNNRAWRLPFPFLNTDPKYKAVNKILRGRIDSTMWFREKLKLTQGDLCDLTASQCGLCNNFWFAVFGYNANQMNTTELPNIFSKEFNSFSLKTFAHYVQSGNFCQFKKYDYGTMKNLKLYKNTTAPDYPLGNIKAPLYFFYGQNDNLGPPNDVAITASKLAPGVLKGIFKVEDQTFNHMDFVIAKDADKLVYNHILEEIQNFNFQ